MVHGLDGMAEGAFASRLVPWYVGPVGSYFVGAMYGFV